MFVKSTNSREGGTIRSSHAGCRLVEADDILVDYSVGLQRNVNEVLGRYSTPSRGYRSGQARIK